MQLQKKKYNLVDFFKLFFAVMVVVLHTRLISDTCSEDFNWYFEHLLLRLAVPFFFVVSGFFLGNKLNKDGGDVFAIWKKYCGKMLLPLIVWGGLNLPFDIVRYCNGQSVGYTIEYIVKTILFFPSGYMWFLWSCIIAATVICIVWKFKCKYILLGIASAGSFGLALLCDSYYFAALMESHLAKLVRLYFRYFLSQRILFGLPFIFAGIVLSRLVLNNKIKRIAPIWIMTGIFLAAAVLEVYFIQGRQFFYGSEMMISYMGLVPCIVLLCLAYNGAWAEKIKNARFLSTGIYYTHAFIIEIVSLFIDNAVIKFMLVLVLAIALSTILGKGRWTKKIV